MYVDIFPNEAGHERPHVSISKNAQHKGRSKIKVWLDTVKMDGNSQLNDFTVREIWLMMKFIRNNLKILRDRYQELHAEKMELAKR